MGSLSGAGSCPVSSLAPGDSTVCTLAVHRRAARSRHRSGHRDRLGVRGRPARRGRAVAAVECDRPGGRAAVARRCGCWSPAVGSPRSARGSDSRIVVTNTGAITLHDVALSDNRLVASAISCPASVLAPGDVITCTGEYTITASDLRAAVVSDVALASALDAHDVDRHLPDRGGGGGRPAVAPTRPLRVDAHPAFPCSRRPAGVRLPPAKQRVDCHRRTGRQRCPSEPPQPQVPRRCARPRPVDDLHRQVDRDVPGRQRGTGAGQCGGVGDRAVTRSGGHRPVGDVCGHCHRPCPDTGSHTHPHPRATAAAGQWSPSPATAAGR